MPKNIDPDIEQQLEAVSVGLEAAATNLQDLVKKMRQALQSAKNDLESKTKAKKTNERSS